MLLVVVPYTSFIEGAGIAAVVLFLVLTLHLIFPFVFSLSITIILRLHHSRHTLQENITLATKIMLQSFALVKLYLIGFALTANEAFVADA